MNQQPAYTIQPYASSVERRDRTAELILHIQRNEYGIPITLEDQPDLLEIETFYQTGKGNFWTALHKGEVIGTIALLDIGQDRAALRKMFVKKEFRGGQYAVSKRLLDEAFAWAEQRGLEEIWLGTTLAFQAAHRFYEKNGFAEVTADMLPPGFPVMEVDKKFYKRIV